MKEFLWIKIFKKHLLLYNYLKNQCRKVLRVIYYALPLSFEYELRLKTGMKNILKKLRTNLVKSSPAPQHEYIGSLYSPYPTFDIPHHRDILLFSNINWHNQQIQRPQDLARNFINAGNRVFFFNNQFIDSEKPGYEVEHLDLQSELYQITLYAHSVPYIDDSTTTHVELAQIARGIAQLLIDFTIISSVTFIQHVNWYPPIKRLPNSIRIFDYHEHKGNKKRVLIESDQVIAASDLMLELAYRYNKNVITIHNVKTQFSLLLNVITNISMPKISVVILTYNNIQLTKDCLHSLLHNDYPNLEIIIVDNASTDGTPAYLIKLTEQHSPLKLILNDKNLGFSAGNNLGLKSSTGDYLVMLNNDTIMTPGALLTMMRHLQSNTRIGLIGPVTNNIGNEAKIDINYSNTAEMYPLAFNYIVQKMGEKIYLANIAFFCVMMPRKVFEHVGLLDENFGLGFFEDDDYCRRVEQNGWKIACAEDAFVHHHLSASFNKLKRREKRTLFEVNKAYYESKWGKWQPHIQRPSSSCDPVLDH